MDDETLEQELLEASQDAAEVAIADLLEHGISVFYEEEGVMVKEDPNGERFEIVMHEPSANYTVVKQIHSLIS